MPLRPQELGTPAVSIPLNSRPQTRDNRVHGLGWGRPPDAGSGLPRPRLQGARGKSNFFSPDATRTSGSTSGAGGFGGHAALARAPRSQALAARSRTRPATASPPRDQVLAGRLKSPRFPPRRWQEIPQPASGGRVTGRGEGWRGNTLLLSQPVLTRAGRRSLKATPLTRRCPPLPASAPPRAPPSVRPRPGRAESHSQAAVRTLSLGEPPLTSGLLGRTVAQ